MNSSVATICKSEIKKMCACMCLYKWFIVVLYQWKICYHSSWKVRNFTCLIYCKPDEPPNHLIRGEKHLVLDSSMGWRASSCCGSSPNLAWAWAQSCSCYLCPLHLPPTSALCHLSPLPLFPGLLCLRHPHVPSVVALSSSVLAVVETALVSALAPTLTQSWTLVWRCCH